MANLPVIYTTQINLIPWIKPNGIYTFICWRSGFFGASKKWIAFGLRKWQDSGWVTRIHHMSSSTAYLSIFLRFTWCFFMQPTINSSFLRLIARAACHLLHCAFLRRTVQRYDIWTTFDLEMCQKCAVNWFLIVFNGKLLMCTRTLAGRSRSR